jgi:hypothetical protein
MMKSLFLLCTCFLVPTLYGQNEERAYVYFETKVGAIFYNDGFGGHLHASAGYQFNDYLGLGISYGGVAKPSFLTKSYSGIGLQYRLNPKAFYAETEFGLILDYSEQDDYCEGYSMIKGPYIFIKQFIGLRVFKIMTVGALVSMVPNQVLVEGLCPDNYTGELTVPDRYKTGGVHVQPFIGLSIPVYYTRK